MVHRTADRYHDAWWIRDYFNSSPDGRRASSQFVVDDQVILQLMPIGETAFHTGAAGKNSSHLGIETCEHNWGTEAWEETYRKLVRLTGYLVRQHGLTISDVTGHFWWDPVDRPYDPTYMGWDPSRGQATGLFDWNQFIADVQAEIARVEIVIQTPTPTQCAPGVLLNGTAYVPVAPYTACLGIAAAFQWDPSVPQVTVEPTVVRVQVRTDQVRDCVEGLLLQAKTYVPIRPYTTCVKPGATITWDPNGPTVRVDLPPAP